MTRIRKAVFPVAGPGTRFLPATKAVPQELLTLVDRPLIDYAIEEARAAGIEQFIFVTSAGKEAIAAHVTNAAALEWELALKEQTGALAAVAACALPEGAAVFVRQDRPLGLGHAVKCAGPVVGNEPFAVVLPDAVIHAGEPCLAQMVAAHRATSGNMVAAMDVGPEAISAHAALDLSERHGRLARATGLAEKPPPEAAPSTLAVMGRYILQPAVLEALDAITPDASGEHQLHGAIDMVSKEGDLWGFLFEGECFDCGSKDGFLEATVALGLARRDLGPAFRAAIAARLPKRRTKAA